MLASSKALGFAKLSGKAMRKVLFFGLLGRKSFLHLKTPETKSEVVLQSCFLLTY